MLPPLVATLGARLRGWSVRLWFSFPVQLFGLQLRQNHLLLTLWVLLGLLIGDRLAVKFGIKYLFLEPEYNGVVGPMSFFLVGIGLGGLIMTWNLTSYLLSARYFAFLATLRRPFGKYCINNALLPVAFLGFYAWHLRAFLQGELDYGSGQFIAALVSLCAGVSAVIAVYVLYFRYTNKDIVSISGLVSLVPGRRRRRRIISSTGGLNVTDLVSGERGWRVDTYLTETLQTRRTRSIAHYSPDQLLSVFRQNHFNALALQTTLLTLLILFGLGIDYAWVRIPAGASVLILFSVVAAITGAVTYWFHAWRTSIFVLFLLVVNFATGRDWFAYRNRAYGLDYTAPLPKYDYAALVEMANPAAIAADKDSMLQILERWRVRTGEERPKLVLLCVSGGGLKATYWTTHVLQEAQRATDGQALRHTALISGASGGMIGAAYVREMLLESQLQEADAARLSFGQTSARGQNWIDQNYPGASNHTSRRISWTSIFDSAQGQNWIDQNYLAASNTTSRRISRTSIFDSAQGQNWIDQNYPGASNKASRRISWTSFFDSAHGQNWIDQNYPGASNNTSRRISWTSIFDSARGQNLSSQDRIAGFAERRPNPDMPTAETLHTLEARTGNPTRPGRLGPKRRKWLPADRPATQHPYNPYVDDAQMAARDSARLAAVGRDLLNSVAFAIVTTDIFLPTKSFEFDGVDYRADRAYAFEQQLNDNLNGAFRKRIGDYEAAERAAEIPMLLLTPSIVNDARRLIISPLGVRHLTLPPAGVGRAEDFEVDAVDFGNFFAEQHPQRLAFSTALRMNATYPYVLPNVYLPSTPPVEVMDAGFRDNFGVMEASRFLQVYRDWILENTGGVVLLQVSTLEKFERPTERSPRGWISSLFSPLGVAGQLISLQDFQLDDNIGLLYELYGQENFTFLRFSYLPAEDRQAASMTFHLTEGEKADIRASIRHPNNLVALERLKASLGGGE